VEQLREAVRIQADTLVAVATNELMIKDGNAEYIERHVAIARSFKELGLAAPFPWRDLWEWHGYWTSSGLDTYASRRRHISSLHHDAIEKLESATGRAGLDDWGSAPPSWSLLEVRLTGMKDALDRAVTVDDRQDVGRRAREILIAAVGLAFDELMVPGSGEALKSGDAKGRFDLILGAQASGSSHAELRALMRSGWELAQKLTHSDALGDVDAFAAAQAVILVVRTLGKMSAGRPNGSESAT
jgi:hypothetical protein